MMKSIHPPLKLKTILLVVLGSLSAYSVAANTCHAIDGCKVPDPENNKIIITADQYYNGIPTESEFKELFTGAPGEDGHNLSMFRVHESNNTAHSLTAEFSPNTEITIDTSYLNNKKYGDHREDIDHTGVSFESETGNARFVMPKGVHFSLQGQPKEFDEGIKGIELSGGYLDSQADFTITAPHSDAYYIAATGAGTAASTANIHDSEIKLDKDSDYSAAISIEVSDNNNALVNVNNMKIQGDGYINFGIDIVNQSPENHAVANVSNTEINLTNPLSSGFYLNNGSEVNVKNSTIKSGIGIMLATTQTEADKHTFTIKDSKLIGQNALLGVNDHRYYVEDAEDDDAIGDEQVAALQPFTLTADHSQLAGRIYIDQDPKRAPEITFNLNNGSSWTINGDSVLDELNIHDSVVSFSQGGKFKTLTINGDLNGSNSLFNMNTSLADGQSDKIKIHGQVHGEHKISVADSRKQPKKPNTQITLVESEGGDGSFSMVQNYVDVGRYRYFFHQNGNDWILSNDNGASSAGGGHYGPRHEISDFANSLISMRQAASQFVYQMQKPLNARFSSRKNESHVNNMWLDSNYTNNHFDSTGSSYGLTASGFKQKSYSLQLGYDHLLPLGNDGNQTYLGAFVGQGHSSVDFNGNYKDGNLKALTTGVYVGWYNTAGWFADAAYRYSHLKANANKMDKATWHSNSLSVDAGKDFSLSDKLVITPKAGITAGRLSGDDYTKSTTFYRSQLGAAVKTTLALNKVNLHPYAGAYWLHDKNSLGHAIVDDSNMRITGAGNSGLYEAGLGVDFNSNNHADFKLDYASGQHTEQKFGINFNYRYSW